MMKKFVYHDNLASMPGHRQKALLLINLGVLELWSTKVLESSSKALEIH